MSWSSAQAPRLYDDLAWLWPHLSPPSDYVADAAAIDALLVEHLGDRPLRLLELGAGGGHTLVHLSHRAAGRHDCVAVDLSDSMLELCRDLIPGIETHVGDMRHIALGQRFDAVLIHDAVDYLLTLEDVAQTCRAAANHLKPGGLLLIAPTYTRETFTDHDVADDGTTTDHAAVTFFSYVHDPEPADDTIEMILIYLIRNQDTRQVEVIEDRHTCGLFSASDWLNQLKASGFDEKFYDDGDEHAWSMFVGRKR